jgi:hypothetical protein
MLGMTDCSSVKAKPLKVQYGNVSHVLLTCQAACDEAANCGLSFEFSRDDGYIATYREQFDEHITLASYVQQPSCTNRKLKANISTGTT